MTPRHLLTLVLASLALCAHAAEPFQLKVSELLQSERAQKFLDPSIKLYWGDAPTPPFPEITRQDINTGLSMNSGLFSRGSKEHCIAAFENALDTLVKTARSGGFDAAFDIRVGQGRTPTNDFESFQCTPAYTATDVRLWASFAMTPDAAQRFAQAQLKQASLPAREPAKGAIFMPVASVVASPELKKILGRHVRAYWGTEAPEYDERSLNPDDYSEEVTIGTLAPEEACRQAALKTLGVMVKAARKDDFDSIIRIRSYHRDQFAPNPTDIECELGKKEASVTLRAFMANRK
ncbi:hypothetical protein [Piscinibacter gummiphilus]|uniref:DUF541 domain-containing protein n=1 Tax=Piscinibacter gummiphilus TaxID=946333 RepID=A0ABZ0CX28_9BURK|nr:hypothetical protein [Piscinibacter gummiphilus]WOB09520.1 hypothetical protein RXV79_05525 [Piscinibacter gummiphilus]